MLYAVHKILKRGGTIKNQPKFDVGTDVKIAIPMTITYLIEIIPSIIIFLKKRL